MRKKWIWVILAAVLLTVLAACAPYDKLRERFTPSSPGPETAKPIDSAAVANTVAVGMYDFDTFNPLTTQSQTVREAMEFVYEPLFSLNEQVQPEPVLAKDYGMSADGKTAVINLREDVQWHDGTQFSAYDAAYTIRMIREGKTTYTEQLSEVADWNVTGDYQITVRFNHPVPSAGALFCFPIMKYGTNMEEKDTYVPIGTGPFAFSGKISTDRYMLNAFDYYYGGKAKIDGVYIDKIPDAEHYIYMCSSGAVDISTSKTIDLRTYTPKGSVVLNEYVSDRMLFLGINNQKQELAGVNTRKALSQMIDKDKIISSILYSRAEKADVPINPSFWLYDNSAVAGDGISAEDHLKVDGWTAADNGGYEKNIGGQKQVLSLELLVNGDNEEKKVIAKAVADDLMRYGVKTRVTELPYEQYTARIESKQYDLFLGETEIRPTQDVYSLLNGGGNLFGYKSDTADTLLAQIGMTSDTEDLKTLYTQLANTFSEEVPFVPISFAKECMMSNPKLKDIKCPGVSGFYRMPGEWRMK